MQIKHRKAIMVTFVLAIVIILCACSSEGINSNSRSETIVLTEDNFRQYFLLYHEMSDIVVPTETSKGIVAESTATIIIEPKYKLTISSLKMDVVWDVIGSCGTTELYGQWDKRASFSVPDNLCGIEAGSMSIGPTEVKTLPFQSTLNPAQLIMSDAISLALDLDVENVSGTIIVYK